MPIVFSLILAVIGISVISVIAFGTNPSEDIFSEMPQYLAFISDRPGGVGRYDVYLFDLHNQKFIPLPGLNSKEDEYHPALSRKAENIFFSVLNPEVADKMTLQLYNRNQEQEIELPNLSPDKPYMHPSLSSDGQLATFFNSFINSDGSENYDVVLYDLQGKQTVEHGKLNSDAIDAYPNISPDGRYLAFQTNRHKQVSRTDIYLYDSQTRRFVNLPNLNSGMDDEYPSLSSNADWIAFSSNRIGALDIHLYDRQKGNLVALPNLNTPHNEFQPAISSDGRWIAYTFLRTDKPSDFEIKIYDRNREVVINLPNVNSTANEMFPTFSR